MSDRESVRSSKKSIALFYKLLPKKLVLLFLVILFSSKPSYAQASFLSTLKDLFIGNDAKAEEVKVVHNSQTMQLLESTPALNPDMKKVKEKSFEIESNEALAVAPVPIGEDYDLETNASNEKIDIYVVKSGDSLNSIAKKFNVNEKALLASNSDLKKADLTKVGQTLVILPTKDTSKEDDIKKKQENQKNKLALEKEEKLAKDKIKKQDEQKKKLALDLSKKEVAVPVTSVVSEVENTVEKEVEVIAPVVTDDKDEDPSTVKGGYIWPLPSGVGVITQGLHDDQAYDFGAPKGTPIYAIQDGTVLIARPTGYNGGYGLYVVINFDDGRQAIFGHMSKVVSEAGDKVKRGDLIGYVGSTGKSTGPHVHIGFRGTLKNPYLSLKKGANSSSF